MTLDCDILYLQAGRRQLAASVVCLTNNIIEGIYL